MKNFLLAILIIGSSGVAVAAPTSKSVILAAGCFWCIQPPYDQLKSAGVLSAIVGYSGGTTDKPTYEQVSSGTTGHIEVIQVTYDPAKITLEKIIGVFWKNIDPFDAKGQFCDKGEQYVSALFYSDEKEKALFEKSKEEIQKKFKEPIVTKILPAKKFFPAEDYHQSYYTKNPVRYKYYRYSCGRDKRLQEVWK